jgi:enoyl-[acyl-carrier protein] reductase II
MLRTPLCDLLRIDIPIVQAPASPYTTPELVSAVSNAGGLGSYSTALRTLERIDHDLTRIRELTDKPFAVNFLMESFDPDAFALVMDHPPAVVSFAASVPQTHIATARERGAIVFSQITTVNQARLAADSGVDVIVAQGSEAGGLTGTISLMPLLPQVVDAVSPRPVVAAGGIGDGRGVAAALVLGAQGVNLGTRFLASEEAFPDEGRRAAFLQAQSEDTLQATILNRLFPSESDTFPLAMRSLRTPFLNEWESRADLTDSELESLRMQMMEAIESGRMGDMVAGAGQSVGLITEIAPAAEIIQRIVEEAEAALSHAARWSAPTPS